MKIGQVCENSRGIYELVLNTPFANLLNLFSSFTPLWWFCRCGHPCFVDVRNLYLDFLFLWEKGNFQISIEIGCSGSNVIKA